jgi:hypothetical protein
MALTKISGEVIQSSVNVGVITASEINVGSAVTIHSGGFIVGGSDLHSTGLTVQNLNATGVVTATSFIGDGSALTGIDATALKDSDRNVKIQANTSGAVVTGVLTATSFSGDGSQLTGIAATTNVRTNSLVVSGMTTATGGIQVGATTSIVIGDTVIRSNSIGIGTTTTTGRNAGVGTAIGTLIFNVNSNTIEFWNGLQWRQLNDAFTVTGGSITNSGGKTIHTFTGTGTFYVNSAPPTFSIDYLVVAGGGAGAGHYGGQLGGGGAGGMRTGSGTPISPGTYTITVGAGGVGVWDFYGAVNPGNPSSIVSTPNAVDITSQGGGGGGNLFLAGYSNYTGYGGPGGSGGGGGSVGIGTGNRIVGTNTPAPSQGSNGGSASAPAAHGGGGGGAGGAGSTGGPTTGGAGGSGTASAISGASVTYAGGGGGGCENCPSIGPGGPGGGGGGPGTGSAPGANPAGTTGYPGTANRGGGGSGGWKSTGGAPIGGSGGSGIVIIAYPS